MRVVLLSNFELPDSCANATRVNAFAKMLIQSNFEVEMLGVAYRQIETLDGTYKGINYHMSHANDFKGVQAYRRTKQLDKDIYKYLSSLHKEREYDAIIISNIYYDFSFSLIKLSKKINVPLIVNEVEWYEKDNELFEGMLGKIRFIQNRIALRYIHKSMHNVIAISSFLGDYYSKKGCRVIVMPTLLDIQEYADISYSTKEKLVMAYAGSPAKKDYIANVVKAIMLLSYDERKKVELHIYGIQSGDLIRLGISKKEFKNVENNVFCHGRIPYEKVKQYIGRGDFTILLRPNKRYANAGFPTKVGESMASGTPVIANITSDLGKYIIDGETGIVCKDETPVSAAEAIRKAINLSVQDKLRMAKEAKKMAERGFDLNSYVKGFQRYMLDVAKR